MRVGAAEWAIALGVGLLLYGVLAVTLVQFRGPDTAQAGLAEDQLPGSVVLGQALLGDRLASPAGNVTGIPGTGYGAAAGLGAASAAPQVTVRPRERVAYLLPFEIVSVHLLVVLIGAAYLARAKRRRAPAGGLRPGEGGVSA
jgi:NADH-quinone oxidoreductase subunit J